MKSTAFAALFLAAHGFTAFSAAGEGSGAIILRIPDGKPDVYERIDITLEGVPAATNPFDPDSIAVDVEATLPSGKKLVVPAFWFRDYDRKLERDREVLSPRDGPCWRARYLPVEAGRHTLEAVAKVDGKVAARGSGAIEATPGKRRGLARVEETGKRYFRFDDGSPLFLNGLCACWHGRRGTFDYDDWLPAYEKAGINYIRLWMWHVAFGIEYHKGDLLKYRLDRAWSVDRVLAEAEGRGVQVMLCFDYHGIFEVKPDYWKSNDEWPRHPYNKANGGPCASQDEFFTSEEARALYRKRLRYIVARWSAFTSVFAWEFFNEIDNEYAYLKHDHVVAWHREMGAHLRGIDPWAHLISSSFTGCSERPDLFALPEMDFSQYHSYNENHPSSMMASKAAAFLERYRKPFYVSEYGTDWKGWKPEGDPHLRALHQAVWSGAFAGAAGTGMSWWWESIHGANLYRHWSALAAFLRGTAIASPGMRPVPVEVRDGKVKGHAVATPREALVWLLDPRMSWPEGAKADPPPAVEGAEVSVGGLEDGDYEAAWWDTLEGKEVGRSRVKVSGGRAVLTAPAFRIDIAARISRT
jgi:hypothetical protein